MGRMTDLSIAQQEAARIAVGAITVVKRKTSDRRQFIPELFHIRCWYDLIRLSFAAVLIVAALLKLHQVASSARVFATPGIILWLEPALAGLELLFGVWLLVGLLPDITRRIALALALGFCFASLDGWLDGSDSCGCFGAVTIHPAWTFTLDLLFVAALSVFGSSPNANGNCACSGATSSRAASCVVWLLFIGTMATPLYIARVLREFPSRLAGANTRVLEPASWIGGPFPLVAFLDVDEKTKAALETGRWLVVLYHARCAECRHLLPHLEARARKGDSNGVQYMVVEVPPYASAGVTASACRWVTLSSVHDWFVRTPVVLVLSDGVVTYAGRGLP
jgi:uncharacterized membrane protein YphA (DoxX/SURF4 family)